LEAGVFQHIEGRFLVATVLGATGRVTHHIYTVLDEAVHLEGRHKGLLNVQLETDILGYQFLKDETATLMVDLANKGARVPPEVL
jgi:hypothetical protein